MSQYGKGLGVVPSLQYYLIEQPKNNSKLEVPSKTLVSL
jgi:hypothetical protein